MKSKLLFIFLLVLAGPSLAQADSTDLDFYSDDVELLSTEDSTIFMNGEISEFMLEFTIDDTASLGKLWVEFILVPEQVNPSLLFQQVYTLSDLQTQELIDEDEVTLSFGHFYTGATYQVVITLEDLDGNEVISITKLLEP